MAGTPVMRRDVPAAETPRARTGYPACNRVETGPYSHASDVVLAAGRLSDHEIIVLAEYAKHGTAKGAGACLGIAVNTVKNHLLSTHNKTGTDTTIETFVALGWLAIPQAAD